MTTILVADIANVISGGDSVGVQVLMSVCASQRKASAADLLVVNDGNRGTDLRDVLVDGVDVAMPADATYRSGSPEAVCDRAIDGSGFGEHRLCRASFTPLRWCYLVDGWDQNLYARALKAGIVDYSFTARSWRQGSVLRTEFHPISKTNCAASLNAKANTAPA
jgi:hypothetical protein